MFFVTCVVIVALGLEIINAVPLASDQQSRIIGGEAAPEAYSPHMVVLIWGERVQSSLCGGSIITRSLVLTAAHCIDAVVLPNGQLEPSFHIRVGSNQWNSGGMTIQVKKYHNHPRWDPENIKYDVGVLVLEKQVVLSDSVAIVQLNFDYIEGNERSVVTGWGRTGPKFEDNVVHLQPSPVDLQILYVNILTHEQCVKQMREVAGDNKIPPIQKDVEVCTFHSPGHGMCVGDSGSALMLESTKQQIGLISWGWGCAEGAPDVSVRLYGVRQFVETLMDVYRDKK